MNYLLTNVGHCLFLIVLTMTVAEGSLLEKEFPFDRNKGSLLQSLEDIASSAAGVIEKG